MPFGNSEFMLSDDFELQRPFEGPVALRCLTEQVFGVLAGHPEKLRHRSIAGRVIAMVNA